MKPAGGRIGVTVVFALPDSATEIPVSLPAGATLADAIEGADLAARHPELNLGRCPVGIFGKRAARDSVLADGDRVEVYRPLIADPKERRLRRAAGRKAGSAK
jgi:uncharacterized protein